MLVLVDLNVLSAEDVHLMDEGQLLERLDKLVDRIFEQLGGVEVVLDGQIIVVVDANVLASTLFGFLELHLVVSFLCALNFDLRLAAANSRVARRPILDRSRAVVIQIGSAAATLSLRDVLGVDAIFRLD